jgi:aspartate racemase
MIMTTRPSVSVQPTRNGHSAAPIWGVLGGAGPLASAAFLQTIYDRCTGWPEQAMPIVWLASDPAFPDRTAALLAGDVGPVAHRLIQRLDELRSLGAQHLVICCMTMHAMLPWIPERLRAGVISLVDVALMAAVEARQPSLLLCTHGARHAALYETSQSWAQARPYIVLPDSRDQQRVHDLIYQLKREPPRPAQIALVDELVAGCGAASIVSGCTELHLLCRATRDGATRDGATGDNIAPHWRAAIDPLTIVADRIVAAAMAALPSRAAGHS